MSNEHENPEPYRGGTYNEPTVLREGRDTIVVEVVIPNEDPETEDDLTVTFTFTPDGMMVEAIVSSDLSLGTDGRSYDEWWNDTAHGRDQ